MRNWDNIKFKFQTANVVQKLIGINILVFILTYLVRAIAFLFGADSAFFFAVFSFPKEFDLLLYKPWSIITYAFLHGGIWHILSNMLILYYAGNYCITYFSQRKLWNFYFFGAIAGALVYMLSYNFFPAFEHTGSSYLVGASASVMAILVGIATHIPHMRIRLFILGSIKFWWIAAFFVILDIVQIPMSNTGGHLAHLGGALLGFIYASQLGKGKDIGKPMDDFMDRGASFFNKKKKKSNLRTVHKNKSTASNYTKKSAREKDEDQQRIDAILDKISKSGYDSLTKKEKDFLFNAGKDK